MTQKYKNQYLILFKSYSIQDSILNSEVIVMKQTCFMYYISETLVYIFHSFITSYGKQRKNSLIIKSLLETDSKINI